MTGYLSLIVLIPLAAIVWRSLEDGRAAFWDAVTAPEAVAALKLTLVASLIVAAVNAVAGTGIAWVLVRDEFPGKRLVNAVIDLPFALPTIVAGLVLLALYGPSGPIGVNVAYTRWAVLLALLFITLPFVVRAVQPVLPPTSRSIDAIRPLLGSNQYGSSFAQPPSQSVVNRSGRVGKVKPFAAAGSTGRFPHEAKIFCAGSV